MGARLTSQKSTLPPTLSTVFCRLFSTKFCRRCSTKFCRRFSTRFCRRFSTRFCRQNLLNSVGGKPHSVDRILQILSCEKCNSLKEKPQVVILWTAVGANQKHRILSTEFAKFCRRQNGRQSLMGWHAAGAISLATGVPRQSLIPGRPPPTLATGRPPQRLTNGRSLSKP